MSKFAHIQRGFDLTDGDIEAAVESREETKALLDQVARVSAPNAGAAKLLLVFARLATTACEWMDGDLRIELVPAGDITVFEVLTDLGGGLRERLFAPVAMNVPIDEYRRSVERLPQLIEPLIPRNQEGGRLILTASAETRRSSMPPPSVHISQESLYGAAMPPAPRAPTMPSSHEVTTSAAAGALPSIVETIKPPKDPAAAPARPVPPAKPAAFDPFAPDFGPPADAAAEKGWRGFPGGGPPPIPPEPPVAAAPEPSPFRGMEIPERSGPSPFRGMDAPIPERTPLSPAVAPPQAEPRKEAASPAKVAGPPPLPPGETPEAPPVTRMAAKARIATPVMPQVAVKPPSVAKAPAAPPPIPPAAAPAPPPIPATVTADAPAAGPPPIPPAAVPAAGPPPIPPVPVPAAAVTPARPRMATIMGVAGPAGPFGINLPGVPPPIPATPAAAPTPAVAPVVPPPIPAAAVMPPPPIPAAAAVMPPPIPAAVAKPAPAAAPKGLAAKPAAAAPTPKKTATKPVPAAASPKAVAAPPPAAAAAAAATKAKGAVEEFVSPFAPIGAKPPPIPPEPAAAAPKAMLSEPPFDLDTLFSSVMPPADADANDESGKPRIQLITQPIPAPAKVPASLMITPDVDEPFPMPLPTTTASPPLPLLGATPAVARVPTPIMPKPLGNDAKTPKAPPVTAAAATPAAKKGGRVVALPREEPESSPPVAGGGDDFPPLPIVGGTRRAPLPKLDPPQRTMPRVPARPPTDSEPPIPGVVGQRASGPQAPKAMDVPTSKSPHVRGPANAGGAGSKTTAASTVTSTKDLFDDQEPELEIDWGNSPPKPRR